MRRTFFIFLTFFITLLSHDVFAQNSIRLSEIEFVNLGDGRLFVNKRDEAKTPLEGKMRIITGFTTEYIDSEFAEGLAIGKWEYFKNNKLSEVINYDKGYITGEKLSYYEDGVTLKSKTPYDNGLENGERLSYYRDGITVNVKTPFVKGKVNGAVVRYSEDGKKEYEKTMKDGLDDGPERTYKDGEVMSEIVFKNGKAEGESFSIYNKGSNDCYKTTAFYKSGQYDGNYKEEYCNGSPKISGKYISGKKDGLWEYYKQDGSRRKPTEGYKDGELIKKITYYINGNIDTERNYKNGKEDGVVKQYTQDGTLKSEKNYINGKQVGKQMQYYSSSISDYIESSNYNESGKLDGEYLETYAETKKVKVKGQYINGQKNGKWLYYSLDGTPTREEVYEKGVQKSSTKL